MANKPGWFDATATGRGWFGAESRALGWFDRELIDTASAGPTAYTADLAETVTLSEAVAVLMAASAGVGDTMTISDSVSAVRAVAPATTTLAALMDAGSSIRMIALIEGYQYALTNAAPAAAVTALAATDWTAALGGLEVEWNLDQRLHPWEPFNSSSSTVTLKVMDVSTTDADTFGLDVFKREGMNVSPLYADTDVLPGSTTVKEIGRAHV